jgi:hypothetical protein
VQKPKHSLLDANKHTNKIHSAGAGHGDQSWLKQQPIALQHLLYARTGMTTCVHNHRLHACMLHVQTEQVVCRGYKALRCKWTTTRLI